MDFDLSKFSAQFTPFTSSWGRYGKIVTVYNRKKQIPLAKYYAGFNWEKRFAADLAKREICKEDLKLSLDRKVNDIKQHMLDRRIRKQA